MADEMKSLRSALAGAVKAIGVVEKSGKMETGPARYTFASHEDVVGAVREALADNGLTLTPEEMHPTFTDHGATKSETKCVVIVTWRLGHTGGGSLTYQSVGEGIDTGDKAGYKAMTGALKYALRLPLLLEIGEHDPDRTPSAEQERGSATRTSKSKGSKAAGSEPSPEDKAKAEKARADALTVVAAELGKYGLTVQMANVWISKTSDQPTLTQAGIEKLREFLAWFKRNLTTAVPQIKSANDPEPGSEG